MPPKEQTILSAYFIQPPSKTKPAKRPASSSPETSEPPPASRPKAESATAESTQTDNGKRPALPDTSKAAPPNDPKPTTLQLTYHVGDIFSAPSNTLIIHACNTQGSWGAGIAAAFFRKYPQAYHVYRRHCTITHKPTTNPVPTGTCLLIPPCETKPGALKHWIGCLFTSAKYGKRKDKADIILANTGPAMEDLLSQLKAKGWSGEARMCMINSGKFGVKWERTAEVLEGIVVEDGWVGEMEVWSMEE